MGSLVVGWKLATPGAIALGVVRVDDIKRGISLFEILRSS